MSTSPAVENVKEMREKKPNFLNANQLEAWQRIRTRIQWAKDQRRQSFRKFDYLTYEDDYQANEDAINSYLRPKRNDDEVRVNTGTIEKKVELLVNELLSFNFQHEVHAFDKDDLEIEELGQNIGDVVTRTNEIEKDEDMRIDAIMELLGQRACFIEEYLEEKKTNGFYIRRCKKRLLSGLQVFMGDLSLPYYRFQEQPFIVKYFRMSYWEAKSIYGDWKNWDKVRPGVQMDSDWYQGDTDWRMGLLKDEECEVIVYESALDNEYQIAINNVPMFDPGEKLPWKHEGYNTAYSITKSMSRKFAYGRPVTSSLKYLQAFKDETVRNLIRKFRQAIEPPKGVAGTGRVYSRDIFEAGKISYGIGQNTFSRLIDHNGITDSDVQMLEMVDKIADEFASTSNTQMGIPEAKKQSATQIIEMRKQAAKMLGLLVFGWTRMVRDLTYLRIYNLVENFTEPEGKDMDALNKTVNDIYSKWTLKNTSLSNEQKGTKIIQFTDKPLSEDKEDALLEFEQKQTEEGNPTEVRYVNAKMLCDFPIMWFVTVTAKEKEDSALYKVMFADKFQQANEMSQTFQRPLNAEKWIEEFQMTWHVKDAFAKPQQPGQEGQPGQEVSPDQIDSVMSELEGLGAKTGSMKKGLTVGTARPASPGGKMAPIMQAK